MRIVGGRWRGRSFEAPAGRDTRPTTDRMRESIASMVEAAVGLDLSDERVLDLFAGSGGVGLELLSRGAAQVTFCERNRKAASLVKRNCASLGADPKTFEVFAVDARLLPTRVAGAAPYTIVFLDPPYRMAADEVSDLVRALSAAGLLSSSCLIVYERARDAAQLELAGTQLIRTKTHGITCVDLIRRGA